jgi:membrane protease YdiL (CAAX protease family)
MFTYDSGRLKPMWSFVLSAAFSLAAFVVCAYIAYPLAREHVLRFELIFRPLLAAALFGLYVWLLTVADQVEGQRAAVLGFPLVPGWGSQLIGGGLLGLGMTVLALIPVAIWAKLTVNVPKFTSRSPARIAAVLIVLVCGALAEELIFRGYPFQRLEEAIGPAGAVGVFSVLFGAVHLMNPGASPLGLVNTVLIGVLLALAYLRTRALWFCWGLHFGWNASLGLLFGLPVSGLRIFNAVVRTSASGPRWLTGGSYGLEASVPGVAAVVAGLLIVWRWPVRVLRTKLTTSIQQPE